jgi:hypothetical protein
MRKVVDMWHNVVARGFTEEDQIEAFAFIPNSADRDQIRQLFVNNPEFFEGDMITPEGQQFLATLREFNQMTDEARTRIVKLSNPNINSPYRPSELLEINPDVESHAFKPDKVTIIITTDTGEVYQSSQKIDEVPKGIYIPIDGKTWLNKLPNGHRPNNVLKPVNTNIANINQVRVEYRDSDHDTEIAQTFDRVPAEDQQ